VLEAETGMANLLALRKIEEVEPRSYIGWAMHLGSTATGSRMLGDYDVARRLCETLAAHVTEADREYVTLFLVTDIERAWCEASEGRPERALAQLDALREGYAASEHPLVHGMIHEARALIAHAAGLERELAESAVEVERWFRPTANPALIAKCERIAALRNRS